MIRKVFAVICIILFALLTLPFIFLKSITNTYLNPSFYEGPIVEESYDYLISFISKEIQKDEKVSRYFDVEEVKEIIETHFTQEAVQEISQDLVSQIKNLIEQRSVGAINVSLAPLKTNISEFSEDVANRIALKEGKPETKEYLQREYERGLYDEIPGELTIDLSKNGTEGEAQLKQLINVIQYGQMILPLFMLILLLLIALVIYKPYTLIMKFLGAALAAGGVLGLIASQFIKQIPDMAVTSENLPELLENEVAELHELYVFLFGFLANKMVTYGLFFAGIGAILIIIALYKKHYSPHKKLEEA